MKGLSTLQVYNSLYLLNFNDVYFNNHIMFEKGIKYLNHFPQLFSMDNFSITFALWILISNKTKLFPAQLGQREALVFLFDPSYMRHCIAIDILISY